MSYDYGWKPYVSVAQRRKHAERELAKLRKKGHTVAPVLLQGRTLAKTFWGKAVEERNNCKYERIIG